MIICGFAGIGKSTMCKKHAGWIDLESTPFNKDFDKYIQIAQHMDKQGYNVMLSCHAQLRQKLHQLNIEYVLVMPQSNLKNEYIERYKTRGNSEAFIENLNQCWGEYTSPYDWETPKYLHSNEYLEDILIKQKEKNNESI